MRKSRENLVSVHDGTRLRSNVTKWPMFSENSKVKSIGLCKDSVEYLDSHDIAVRKCSMTDFRQLRGGSLRQRVFEIQ